MRIVLLTRTSRPSGALIAKKLIENKKNLVAIIAEERAELLKKKGSQLSIILNSLKNQGFGFTLDKLIELINIKLHFLLRKTKVYRGNHYLSIEEFVLDHKVPYFVIKDHNSRESQQLIRKFSPDLIIITNTRVIKNNILQIPKHGCLNLHGSELPKYAGLDSIFWQLFYAEKEIGVTVHFASCELDRGDIVSQGKIKVSDRDNEKTLYRKATQLGAELMVEAVTQIEQNKVKPIKQDLKLASRYGWPSKEERRLLRKKLRMRRKRKAERPIKVLHIITRLIKGGAQENTLLTVLGLREKGYDVMLASGPTHGPEGEIESLARKMGVNLVVIPELIREPHPWKDLISFIKIYNLIRMQRFDIVHTHTSKAGIIGRLAAKFAGTAAIVHTPHGHIFHSYFGPLKTRLFYNLEVVFARFCDKIITLTDKCKEEHIKFRVAPEDKFVTIHSGISLERFRNDSFDVDGIKAGLNIPLNYRVVGTVVRIEPVKGVKHFVDSARLVLDSVPDVHFLVVGDGSQRSILQQRTRDLGIDRNVTFTGIRDDVPELISIMDVFVLPSLNEGMGRVLVEAGVMSKPVVATRVSGIPELVQDRLTGILVEPKNTQELAGGIIELLSDAEKARKMGENARLRMAENFSDKRMMEKIEKLYKELL